MRKVTIKEIRDFVNHPKNVARMIAASDNGRPAVEPLQHDIEIQFGPFTPSPRFDWFRMRFGRETRYVMEANGYRLAQRGIHIGGKVFSYGSRYEKI